MKPRAYRSSLRRSPPPHSLAVPRVPALDRAHRPSRRCPRCDPATRDPFPLLMMRWTGPRPRTRRISPTRSKLHKRFHSTMSLPRPPALSLEARRLSPGLECSPAAPKRRGCTAIQDRLSNDGSRPAPTPPGWTEAVTQMLPQRSQHGTVEWTSGKLGSSLLQETTTPRTRFWILLGRALIWERMIVKNR